MDWTHLSSIIFWHYLPTPHNKLHSTEYLLYMSKAYASMHALLGLCICYFFHPENTSLSLATKVLLILQNPAERSFLSTTFPFVYCRMFIVWLHCARHSSGCWTCPSSMCSHNLLHKSLLTSSHCSSSFLYLTVFPIILWAPRGQNYTLFIFAQH